MNTYWAIMYATSPVVLQHYLGGLIPHKYSFLILSGISRATLAGMALEMAIEMYATAAY